MPAARAYSSFLIVKSLIACLNPQILFLVFSRYCGVYTTTIEEVSQIVMLSFVLIVISIFQTKVFDYQLISLYSMSELRDNTF
jgi:hypothetical protein